MAPTNDTSPPTEPNPPLAGPVSDGSPGPTASLRAREAFVLELGAALIQAGMPSHRLEDALGAVCHGLGLEAEIFSTPTSLWAAFGDHDDQHVMLTRTEPQSTNLERLARLDHLSGEVARGELSSSEGRDMVREILRTPPRFPLALLPLLFGVSSACVAVFFGGAFRDVAGAALIGCVLGGFVVVSNRIRRIARGMDFLSGFVAAAGAGLLAWIITDLSAPIVTLAGLITLVPGLTLTLAVGELAARHMVSGTARLMHALTILISIGFGVALGRALVPLTALDPNLIATVPAAPLPFWAFTAALVVLPPTLAMVFQSRYSDWPAVAIAAWAGFFAARFGAMHLGPELGASVGAFAVGLIANGHARIRRVPAALASLPGIMLLVPGSLGLRTFESLLADDAIAGVDTAFSTILIAAGLIAGLLMANVVLPSRQPL